MVPEIKLEPPVGAAYQFIVPAEALAFKVTAPASHLLAVDTEVMLGVVFTVAATLERDAEIQPLFTASA